MEKQNVLTSLLILGVTGVFVYALSGSAYAQSNGQYSPLIQRLIEKFNLNKTDVDKIVQEFRTERQTEMRKSHEERLNQAVKDGKLTNEQKNKILSKFDEFKNKRDEFANLTPEERQKKMQEHKEELEKWAEENDIDESYIFGFGRRFHKGFAKGFRFGQGL
ncbi:hypothetical protein A2716_04355 [candidate division WWE3 bacterium RIFCSPHIGHO2_01_FULL_40_23]|uniref:Uncharacterized protein n=1 Tax=candidate division WWE3 bacterium RIFCSPLOWO2_01_FULL_41_18 TaxID=1802625 RepID=A0A1F4VCY2_UNCKA|nr:MAG: hypothetical protein A2716_04355 [candidate division WWE3 bacterium RIFCSPHIGHO2_01_FULL_40_23]OGC55106.1 MAG: hypothetical protein A3A78_03965 [candidate division WWE3 bacterium RIFCSPLOWO2_01_FULL_41_18]